MKTTETTETTKITKTEDCTETIYTAAFTTVNTDAAPVTRYSIGTNYTYGTRTYSIVGVRKYTGDAHSYWLVKFDSDPTTHELTADKIKDYVGDDRKQPRNGSANDTPNGAANKSKRTAQETATAVTDKYNGVISKVRDQVSKLVATDSITAALNALIEAIETARDQRVEAINNAALAAHLQRVERLQAIDVELPDLQARALEAMQGGDFAKSMDLSKRIVELQAELLLLQQQEATYNATLATASEDTDTDTEAQE